jgi:hypothetical protein
MISRRFGCGVLCFAALLLAIGQVPIHGQEPANVWTLDVKFENIKTMKVNLPGRGQKNVSYLVYEITNNTKEPREVSPSLQLVADKSEKQFTDEVLVSVLGKLPAGLENSVSVSKKPIPPGGKVRVVAIWDDVDPAATRFTVFVGGLSNSFTLQDKTTRFKTLQARFQREEKAQDLRLVGVPDWAYRERGLQKP